ncbi:MAG: hypothetical protein IJS44_06290, partial [Clostridia bacterium]|nr:hypothetical protein [Clostridia bacterium]
MQKKILCLLLTICMLLSLVPMTVSAADDIIEIATAEQLGWLMNRTADTGYDSWTASYKLTADIDMSSVDTQAPIGLSNADYFSGSFDGDGHTISGLDIDTGSKGYAALFGYAQDATIENLKLYGSVSSTGAYTGALIAVGKGACTIRDIESHVTVSGGSSSVGVIGAYVPTAGTATTISGLVNYGTITGTKYLGGILGLLQTASGSGASFSISNSVNYGSVTGSGVCVGGVVGYILHTNANANRFVIDTCENRGAVQGTTYVGGIVGAYGDASKGSATKFTFSSLSNRGTVTATTGVAAGIVGMSKPSVKDIALYEDCVNYGEISTPYGAAGIISVTSSYAFSMARCYNGGAYTPTSTNATYPPRPILSKDSTVTASDIFYGGSENASETHGTYLADPTSALAFENFDFSDTWAMGTAGPEIRAFHTHNQSAPVSVSNDSHRLDCTCGEAGAVAAHNFVDDVCTVCGFEKTDCTHGTTHDVITLAPTCVATGLKDVVCDVCGNTIASGVTVPVDPENHVGNLVLGFNKNEAEEIDYYCDACDAVVYEDYSYATDVYVSAFGATLDMANVPTDAIGTEQLPFANFADAMTYAAYAAEQSKDGVTVHILDSANISGRYQTPESDYGITVTGGTLNFAAASSGIMMNGDMTFEDITFTANNGTSDLTGGMLLAAQGHKLVLGDGIVMGNSGTATLGTTAINSVKMYVLGGYQNTPATSELHTDVTVRSGEYWLIAGWNRQNSSTAEIHGDAKLTVGNVGGGTLKIGYLVPFSANNNCYISASSKSTVTIDGVATIAQIFTVGNSKGTVRDGVSYQTDFVLRGDLQNTDAAAINGVNLVANSGLGSVDIELNVYTDTRVATAVEDSAAFVGENKSANLPETVGDFTYFVYCTEYLGGHTFGAGGVCTLCGFDSSCAHANTHEEVTLAATCVSTGTRVVICDDCGATVSTTEIAIDPNNHADTALVWNYDSQTGEYYLTCSACSAAYGHTTEAPVVYVNGTAGDNANDGMTASTAVKTLSAAIPHIANCGGTVVITSYTLSANETLPSWNGLVTFTASAFDKYGAATTGILIGKNGATLTMGGDAKFDGILFKGTSESVYRMYLAANWNNLDIGYVRVQNHATAYVFAGPAYNGTTDTAPKTVHLNLDMPAMSTNAGDYFYERIYLGSAINSASADIENKNVTLTVNTGYVNTQASARTLSGTIGTIYAISTTSNTAYNNAVVDACTANIQIGGEVVVNNFRTGDANTALYPAAVSLDNLTLTLNDNATIANFLAKNVKNANVTISTGRTVKQAAAIRFVKVGAFEEETAALTMNYDTHSFVPTIDSYFSADGYTVTDNGIDACEWDNGVITTEPTEAADGVRTYTCLVCGKTKTETVPFDCANHAFVIKADGNITCSICKETFTAEDIANDVIVSVAPQTVALGAEEITVEVSLEAATAFAAARFSVNAPAGFTLTGMSTNLSALGGAEGLSLTGASAYALPYNMAVIRYPVVDATLAKTVVATLTFAVDESVEEGNYVITLTAT